jgi:hypothetical protein
MRTTKMLAGLGTLTVCLGVPTIGTAEDNCSGHMVNIGGKRVVVNSDHEVPGYPLTGECRSTGTGTGSCSYRDKDGDEYTSEWKAVPGTTGRYTWKVVSGTGKYAKATSFGWSRRVLSEGNVIVELWGGECNY